MGPVKVLWNGDGVLPPPGKDMGPCGSIMGWRWGTPSPGKDMGPCGSIMGWRWGTPSPWKGHGTGGMAHFVQRCTQHSEVKDLRNVKGSEN